MHITLEIFNKTDCFFCRDKVNRAAGRRTGVMVFANSILTVLSWPDSYRPLIGTWYRQDSSSWPKTYSPPIGTVKNHTKI